MTPPQGSYPSLHAYSATPRHKKHKKKSHKSKSTAAATVATAVPEQQALALAHESMHGIDTAEEGIEMVDQSEGSLQAS